MADSWFMEVGCVGKSGRGMEAPTRRQVCPAQDILSAFLSSPIRDFLLLQLLTGCIKAPNIT